MKLLLHWRGPYVGQSKQDLARINQQIAPVLGLRHDLRDGEGRTVFVPSFDVRLSALNDIETIAGQAVTEAKRMQFFCAFCDDEFDNDYLGLAELLLIRRLSEAEYINHPPVADFDNEVIVESELSALAEADEKLLRGRIGAAPLRVEETVA